MNRPYGVVHPSLEKRLTPDFWMGAFRARSRVAPRGIYPGVISELNPPRTCPPIRPDSTPGRERFFEIVRTGAKAHLPAFAVRGHSGDFGMMAEPIGSFGPRKPSLLGRVLSENIDKYR